MEAASVEAAGFGVAAAAWGALRAKREIFGGPLAPSCLVVDQMEI